jgi:hypothetical protein
VLISGAADSETYIFTQIHTHTHTNAHTPPPLVMISGAANSGVPHCCVRFLPKGTVTQIQTRTCRHTQPTHSTQHTHSLTHTHTHTHTHTGTYSTHTQVHTHTCAHIHRRGCSHYPWRTPPLQTQPCRATSLSPPAAADDGALQVGCVCVCVRKYVTVQAHVCAHVGSDLVYYGKKGTHASFVHT